MTCVPGTAPDVCWTVGAVAGTSNKTLVEQYTGGATHAWTPLQGSSAPYTSFSPNAPIGNGDQLQDISCMSNGKCFAVELNYFRNGATTLPWNPLIEECTSDASRN
jgi:hypothetical protein